LGKITYKVTAWKFKITLKWILGNSICERVQAYDYPVVGRTDSDDAVYGWMLPQFRVLRI